MSVSAREQQIGAHVGIPTVPFSLDEKGAIIRQMAAVERTPNIAWWFQMRRTYSKYAKCVARGVFHQTNQPIWLLNLYF